ncbi:MAG: hydratase [Hyphomicrobiales bacterium]|nr:MAG: hydratase [Hyphomicrobiales bacterium]
MTTRAEEAADLLASLALSGKTIERLPDALRPASEADAMAVQRALLSRRRTSGWKVGPHPSGSGWAGAPLRGHSPLASPATLTAQDAASMQIEVEVAVVLGSDLPAGATPAEAKAAIGTAHLAFELFRSSYADRTAQDVPSLLADHFNNAGIVLGSGRPLTGDDDLAVLTVQLHRDGAAIGDSGKGASLDLVLESLCWLAGYASELGAPLQRGTAILTGARIGPLSVAAAGAYAGQSPLGDAILHVGR